MKLSTCRRWVLASLVTPVAALLLVGVAFAGGAGGKQNYVPNEYIIHAYAGTSLADVQESVTAMGATLAKQLPVKDTYLIRMGGGAGLMSGRLGDVRSRPKRWVVDGIQPNYCYYTSAIPNDEFWKRQWDMRLINMPAAWELAKGSPSVTVAVIDTGVANHPDLVGRLVVGYDFIDNDADPSNDLVGHGTHVSGTIAAQGGNGIGICGVNWKSVKIMSIRVFGTGGSTTDVLIQGEDWALKNGAQIANMSYGGYGDDPLHRAKMTEMASPPANMILVAAAGNDSTDLPGYPAAYPEVIAVSSVGPYDALAFYSNYGKIEIAAPGGDSSFGLDGEIFSTYVGLDATGNPTVMGYAPMQGTSMACPHVAGAAALLMSYGVPASDVKNRLMSSARLPKSGGMNVAQYGAGILDVQAALANAVVMIISPEKGSTVSSDPNFKISIQGVVTSSIKVYVDYADLNDDGVPDNPNEGVVVDATNVNYYLDSTQRAVEFQWSSVSSTPLKAGSHNVYVSATAIAGGNEVTDWGAFNVAKRKISKGLHLFAFPYALTDRVATTPSKILPGAKFGLGDMPRSSLMRWMATPRSAKDPSPIGYQTYTPGSLGDRVWTNPLYQIGLLNLPTGGGYYYDILTQQPIYSSPAGSGFWLLLATDVYLDESIATMETLPVFDGSKGYNIPIYAGWNMIGNPYAHAVSWRAALFTYRGQTKSLLDAESAGWVRSTLYGYAGSSSGYQRVYDTNMLDSYNGYWLLALVGGISTQDSLMLNVLP